MAKYHIDKLAELAIMPDTNNDDTSCKSIFATYFESGVPYRTDSIDLAFDEESRDKVVKLLQSAIEKLNKPIQTWIKRQNA